MASDDQDLEPDLYCNIDDDENSKYIVPAGTHATSRRRKSWPGPAASAPLAEAESSQQQPNSSKPAALAVRETTGQEPAPATPAETVTSGPAPLAGEDSGKELVVSTTTEAADDAQEMPNPSGPAPLAGEDSGAAQASSCSAPLAVAASEGAPPAQQAVVSKQQRKAAALSKILGKGQPRQLQPPAPKKIIIKLKDRKPQPAEPVLPKQPPKPRTIVELASARDVRTVAALVKATKKKYFQWMKKQPPGPPPPAPFTDESWKTHKYGRILWAEYCQLAPAIRIREIADKKAKSVTTTATATMSQLPSAIAAPSTTAAQQHLDEWAQQFLPSTSSAANEMTEAEARQAEAAILGANEPQQPDEEMPFVLAPPPQPPNLDEIMEDVSKLFKPPQAAETKAAAPGPFRNQSPPSTPRDPRLVRQTIVPPPPPPLAKSPPALTTSPTDKVRQWLHSSVAPSTRQPPQKTKEAARSQETSQSGSRESRQQSGKRAHTATGTSAQPPTHRRREVSTSPVRDQSPGVARKNRLRAEAKRPPIPLIDGCMNKDIGIFYKRTGRDLANQQWHQVLDKSNDHLIFLGGINEIGIPGVYLPVAAYQPLQPDATRPIADLKRAEFDAEQTIIPPQYILCNTFGAYPRYAEMVTSQTRQHFYDHAPPTEKYHAELRFGGVGPTGYDLRTVPDNVYFDVVAAQRTALVRYARIARKTKRCLRIYIQCSGPGPNGFNLHADAIRVLLKVAKLDPDHPIHLVKYNGTTMDIVCWLEAFPNMVFGISPYAISEHLAILAKYPADSLLYKDTDAMRTLLRRMPLRNLAIQSNCPSLIEGTDAHQHPLLLLRIGQHFERLTRPEGSTVPDQGVIDALYINSAQNLCRIYGLNSELLAHMANAANYHPERLTLQQGLVEIRARFAPAARADPSDQDANNRGRRSSIAEASPASIASPQKPVHRSQSAKNRRSPSRSPSPTKRRGRSPDKHHRQKKNPKPAPLAGGGQKTTTSSKPAPLAVREQQKRHSEKKEHSSSGNHRSKETEDRRQSSKTSGNRSSGHDSRSRSRHHRSPVRHQHKDRRSPPRMDPPRRRVELSPPSGRVETSATAVPKLRVTVPRSPPRPSVASQIIVPPRTEAFLQTAAHRESTSASDRQQATSRQSSTSSRGRIPIAARIGLKDPSPHSSKDALKQLRQRQGGQPPAPLAGRYADYRHVRDPLLKPEPVLLNLVAPPSSDELLEAVNAHLLTRTDPETGKESTHVNAESLRTEEVPRAQPAVIQITHGCDLPWDPLRLCTCEGALDHDHFRAHDTLRNSEVVGSRRRWVGGAIKKSDTLMELLENVLDMAVHSFGQMILLKYGARFRRDDHRNGEVLRFINAVLTATNLERQLPGILHYWQPRIMAPNANRIWPDEQDFYRAAESWVCYCQEAFAFLFERLNGPASWDTDFLQSHVLPQEARESIITTMVDRAQEHFDRLRHQLYMQYGLRHIEAGGKKFSWTRFDDLDENRIPIEPGTVLEEPTICFVDETINVTFGRSLRETVLMIVLPEGRTDEILKFVRQYYPAGTVERAVFWFGRRYIMDRREFYRDLVADMCHHFAVHFGRLEQYVVLPSYMLDYDPTWTMGPLAVFAQRRDVAPHARVALDELDLHLWLGNAIGADRPLPDSIDATGRLLTREAVMERKHTLTADHDLDLWRNTEELEREPLPGYTMGQQNRPAEKGAPAPLAASPTSPADTERVPAPLAYSPVATPRPKSPPTTSGDDFFKNNPGFEKIAEYTARRINDKLIANVAAKLSTVEKAVDAAESANAEMDDSDALSEPTPNKDRESQQ